MLEAGESTDDAITGCLGIALKRASLFGRAPTIHDLEIAFRIWGFLGDDPVSWSSCARRCSRQWPTPTTTPSQREIADTVPEATLRLLHTDVAARFPGEWRALLGK